MYNANKPDASELPSTKQLLKSTGVAAVIATALLVTVILPAEYGVDPTGAGSLLGLTEMGRIKMTLAAEAKADAALSPDISSGVAPPLPVDPSAPATNDITPAPLPAPIAPPSQSTATQTAPAQVAPKPAAQAPTQVKATTSDELNFTLAPDEAIEFKLVMKSGAKAKHLWFTDGGKVNYDAHGDGKGISYHGYGKGTTDRSEGELTAPFEGHHGWFWRNRTEGDITITLRTNGEYTDLIEVE